MSSTSGSRVGESDVDGGRQEGVSHYRAALCLVAAIALTHVALFLFALNFGGINSAAIEATIISLLVLLGLWGVSKVARYLGAAWFLFFAASLAWTVSNATWRSTAIVAWALVTSALNLATAWLLLLSKQFAREFAHQQQTQPSYKRMVRTVAVMAVVAAIVFQMYRVSPSLP